MENCGCISALQCKTKLHFLHHLFLEKKGLDLKFLGFPWSLFRLCLHIKMQFCMKGLVLAVAKGASLAQIQSELVENCF